MLGPFSKKARIERLVNRIYSVMNERTYDYVSSFQNIRAQLRIDVEPNYYEVWLFAIWAVWQSFGTLYGHNPHTDNLLSHALDRLCRAAWNRRMFDETEKFDDEDAFVSAFRTRLGERFSQYSDASKLDKQECFNYSKEFLPENLACAHFKNVFQTDHNDMKSDFILTFTLIWTPFIEGTINEFQKFRHRLGPAFRVLVLSYLGIGALFGFIRFVSNILYFAFGPGAPWRYLDVLGVAGIVAVGKVLLANLLGAVLTVFIWPVSLWIALSADETFIQWLLFPWFQLGV